MVYTLSYKPYRLGSIPGQRERKKKLYYSISSLLTRWQNERSFNQVSIPVIVLSLSRRRHQNRTRTDRQGLYQRSSKTNGSATQESLSYRWRYPRSDSYHFTWPLTLFLGCRFLTSLPVTLYFQPANPAFLVNPPFSSFICYGFAILVMYYRSLAFITETPDSICFLVFKCNQYLHWPSKLKE